jgi:hypothetical protein
MSWATFEDVTDRWIGPNAPADDDLVTALIADAESVILSEYPRIQERIDAETLPLSTVILVVVRMVSRQLRNPEGLTYWQQTTGPFGQARNFGSAPQDLWLTPEEKNLLSPRRKGKAFSVDLAPDAGLTYVERVTEADQISGEVSGLVGDFE